MEGLGFGRGLLLSVLGQGHAPAMFAVSSPPSDGPTWPRRYSTRAGSSTQPSTSAPSGTVTVDAASLIIDQVYEVSDRITLAVSHAAWQAALMLPSVRGLVVGRTMLYPPDGDVAAAVDTAVSLVR